MRVDERIRVCPARPMRWLRWGVCVAGLALVAATGWGAAAGATTAPVAKIRVQKKVAAVSPWEQAEQGRDALEAIPEETRTRADYARAMDAYRAIYHAKPGDVHAPAAVNAVAELLVEQGREMGGSKSDAKSLKAAVGQYEFLRTQYPGSSLRVQALLMEAQIEQNDLGDAAAAREKYTLLLKLHPKSEQAEEARAGLESLEQWSVVSSQLSEKTVGRKGVPSLPTYPTPASKDRLSGTPVPTPTSNNRSLGTPCRRGPRIRGNPGYCSVSWGLRT